MQPGAPQPQPRSVLPVVALVVSVLGLCTGIGWIAGIILGIVALVRLQGQPGHPGRWMAITAIIVPFLVIPVLFALAIPNFTKFQARSKQSECKTNLKAIWNAEVAYRAANGKWTDRLADLDLTPILRNRYAYFLSPDQVVPIDPRWAPRGGPDLLTELHARGIVVGLGNDGFTAACIGNIDNDPTLDIWVVSSGRRSRGSQRITPGIPFNEVNDVTE